MMMSYKAFVAVVTVVAVVDAASLRDVARDVRSDRVLLNAGLAVAAPQFQNQQKVDLSRLDVPTGILLLHILYYVSYLLYNGPILV